MRLESLHSAPGQHLQHYIIAELDGLGVKLMEKTTSLAARDQPQHIHNRGLPAFLLSDSAWLRPGSSLFLSIVACY